MDTAPYHSRNSARAALLQVEHSRTNPALRNVFWLDGSRWDAAFQELTSKEAMSDELFRHEITHAAAGIAKTSLEQRYFGAIEQDIVWWQHFASTLAQAQAQLATQTQHDEWATHHNRAAWHLLERQMTACQMYIDMLERRRSMQGGLEHNQWQEHWANLQTVLQQQCEWYQPLPDATAQRMLKWCQELLHQQRTTLNSWRNIRNAESNALRRDMASVQKLIDAFVSPPQRAGSNTGIVVAVILVGFLFLAFAKGNSTKTSTPTAIQPTPIGIRGAAIAATQAAPTAPPTTPSAPPADQARLYGEGIALLQSGNCTEAVAHFRAAYDAEPGSSTAYYALDSMAFCLYDLNRSEEAIAKWEQALASAPNSPDANAGLGMALYSRGQTEQAVARYRAALSTEPGYADEAFLRTNVSWSDHAITQSRELRAAAQH